MTVTLSQTQSASFPDRPGEGGYGLLATLAVGSDVGEVVEHTESNAMSVFHSRVLIKPGAVSGGKAVVLGGFDGGDIETFRLVYDAETFVLGFELATGDVLATTLATELCWHTIELSVNTVSGTATLLRNGRLVVEASGSYTSLATALFRLGVLRKDTVAIGEIAFDEWAVADASIGPVTIAPSRDDASDPARWLVLYNTTDSDSMAWAQRYRDAREIPYANLLGLDLSSNEILNAAEFSSLNSDIENYLSDTGLDLQVAGILLGYGVPGYVDFTGSGPIYSVGDLLHRPGAGAGVSANINALNTAPSARPTFDMLGGDRMTARVDGPDVNTADQWIDRATALMVANTGDGNDATIYLDPFAGSSPTADPITDRMLDWFESLDRQRLRLPIQLSGPIDSTTSQSFDEISHDGFFWGWAQALPSSDFLADSGGRRVFCAQLDIENATALTLRTLSSLNWITSPMQAGYAAAIATSKPVSASAVPYVRPFFDALRQGWTLAEAWYLSLPLLREGFYLVGDPLMRVQLPKSGWDVFGPLSDLVQLDSQEPTALLRLEETSINLPSGDGLYVVQRVDEQGRSEANGSWVRVVNNEDVALRPILSPIWPRVSDWSARIVDGMVELSLWWDRSIKSALVSTIELFGEVDGQVESKLLSPNFSLMSHGLRVNVALPNESARYRWRIESIDGAVWWSPWSQTVSRQAMTLIELQQVEVF